MISLISQCHGEGGCCYRAQLAHLSCVVAVYSVRNHYSRPLIRTTRLASCHARRPPVQHRAAHNETTTCSSSSLFLLPSYATRSAVSVPGGASWLTEAVDTIDSFEPCVTGQPAFAMYMCPRLSAP